MSSQRFTKKYLSGARSAKAIYGIILITAALIGFQLLESESFAIAIKVFFAALVIVLAEIYAEFLGEKIRHKKHLSKAERREIVSDTLVISSVASYPVVVFLVSAAGLYSTALAFKFSYALSIAGLALFGYVASRAAGDSKNTSLRRAAVTAAIGVLVILIKYRFSH